MVRVLVTGATGFIGRALTPALVAAGWEVVAPGRAEIGDIGPQTDWRAALEGAEAVVHLGALAHARHGERALMAVNAEGARALAEQAAEAGVRRFILMSSVKAAGEASGLRALSETDQPTPMTAYGRSKRAAEEAVLGISALNPIALRPPLVHDWDARANFAALLGLAASPLPLPFAQARNRRSLIARASLVAAIGAVLAKPEAQPGAYFVADHPALSTGEIITALRAGLGRKAGLIRAPLLAALAPHMLRQNLEVDDARFRGAFAFEGIDTHAALAATMAAWKARH